MLSISFCDFLLQMSLCQYYLNTIAFSFCACRESSNSVYFFEWHLYVSQALCCFFSLAYAESSYITMLYPYGDLVPTQMENFAYWLASFLNANVVDTSVPCRFDLLLKMCCWHLPCPDHRRILLQAQRVAKWCERRRKARPNLPLFAVNGRFPKLRICCKNLERNDSGDCIEWIAERLAIDLEYAEQRQLESFAFSPASWRKNKRIHNKKLEVVAALTDK